MELSAWRSVTAEGFTFCVPPEWRAVGRTWRHGEASISWGTGAYRPRKIGSVVTTVVTTDPSRVPLPEGPPENSAVHRFSEEIDGRIAQVWRNRFGVDYHTGATWASPRVWMHGEANDAHSANLQVTIFRTVRFAPPPRDETIGGR